MYPLFVVTIYRGGLLLAWILLYPSQIPIICMGPLTTINRATVTNNYFCSIEQLSTYLSYLKIRSIWKHLTLASEQFRQNSSVASHRLSRSVVSSPQDVCCWPNLVRRVTWTSWRFTLRDHSSGSTVRILKSC